MKLKDEVTAANAVPQRAGGIPHKRCDAGTVRIE